jgi:tRNA(fMet)-specific endonuclease VapC
VYILDTNMLIYFFKGMGNVAENLLASSPKDIGIPSVVLYELQYGIAKPIGPYDVMIAGTAVSQQGILITNNVNEFKRVPKLKIENWF